MIAIAAMAANRIIGKNNGMPWPRSKEDFAFFREKTLSKPVIVGRTTFTDLPVLHDRIPVIISSQEPEELDKIPGIAGWGNYGYLTPLEAATIFPKNLELGLLNDLVCIGGAKTYALCLPYCDSLFLTIWDKAYDGDTKMPDFEHLFPGRRKIRTIEGGTIWEYMTTEKLNKEYQIVVDNPVERANLGS